MRFRAPLRAPGTCYAIVLLCVLAVPACSLQREGHEWIRQRPPEAFNAKWEEVPRDRLREVAEELRQDAIALLQTESGRLMSEEEIRRFVPGASSLGGRWYLLRAVRSPENDGDFHVLTRGRDVAVTYRTPSRRNETVKTAVAAQLEDSPQGIFTEIAVR